MWTPVCMEPTLKYHPGNFEVLTQVRYPDRGQCMVGGEDVNEVKGEKILSEGLLWQ